MRTTRFGDRDVSVIALGSTDFGGKCPASKAAELLDAYASIGGNYIDTAHMYGDFLRKVNGESEKAIGRWMSLNHNRDRMFVSTKGAHPDLDALNVPRLDRASIRRDMFESLDALETDHVDIYWLHRDDVNRPVGDILETLQGLYEEGLTRMIGVSNWTLPRVKAIMDYAATHGLRPLDGNQPQFSLAETVVSDDPTLVYMDSAMWQFHNETKLPCTPFTSRAKGFFVKLDEQGADALPDKAKRRYYHPCNLAIYERLKTLREQTGYSINAMEMAYLTCQPFTVIPLVGCSRIAQVEAMAEAADTVLTPEQRDYLRIV